RLANAELRLPAEAPHLPGIEEDEGVVPDPAALTAGIAAFRVKLEVAGDPADRIVHLAIFIGAEVEDVDLVPRGDQSVENRVDAVPDVKVGLPLPAVAEDIEPRRIGEKLLVEVEDVAVRVALAEDRDEAEDPAAHPIAFAVGRDHPLARQFRGAVERGLDRE